MSLWKRRSRLIVGLGVVLGCLGPSDGSAAVQIPIMQSENRLMVLHQAEKAFREGEDRFYQGEYDQAEACFRTSLSIFPEYADSAYYMAEISYRSGEYSQAQDWIRKAKKAHAFFVMLSKDQPELYLHKRDQLKMKLERLRSEKSGGISAEEDEVADLEYEIGLINFKLTGPLPVRKQIPSNYHDCCGRILLALGHTTEAHTAFLEAVERDSSSAGPYEALIRLELEKEHYAKAISFLSLGEARGITLDAELKSQIFDIQPGGVAFDLGFEETSHDDAPEESQPPGDVVVSLPEAQREYEQALAAFEDGKEDEAEKGFRTCLRIFPRHAGASFHLSRICSDRGEFLKALEFIRKAEANHPFLSASLALVQTSETVRLQQQKKKISSRLELLRERIRSGISSDSKLKKKREALEKDLLALEFQIMSSTPPSSDIPADYSYLYGNICLALKRYHTAMEKFVTTIKRDPLFSEAYNPLAALCIEMGSLHHALICYYIGQIYNAPHDDKLLEGMRSAKNEEKREWLLRRIRRLYGSAGSKTATGRSDRFDENMFRAFMEAEEILEKGPKIPVTRKTRQFEDRIRSVLKIFPLHAQALTLQAKLLLRDGRIDQALSTLRKAKACFILTRTYSRAENLMSGMLEKKRASLKERTRMPGLRSEDPSCLMKAAWGADLDALKSTQHERDTVEDIFRTHGDILFEKKEYSLARESYLQALSINPHSADIHLQMSRLCVREGRSREAGDYMFLAESFGASEKPLMRKIDSIINPDDNSRRFRGDIRGFYIQLKGGRAYPDTGDFNRVIQMRQDYVDAHEDLLKRSDGIPDFLKPDWFQSYSAEFGYQINRFAIGLEVGSVTQLCREKYTSLFFLGEGYYKFPTRLTVLNLKYQILDLRWMRILLHSGGGVYTSRFESGFNDEVNDMIAFKDEYRQSVFGFHLGSELEISIFKQASVILNSRYRFVNFTKMTGTSSFFIDTSWEYVDEGILFVHESADGTFGGFNRAYQMERFKPLRSAEFNLNGWEFSVGIKLAL